MGEDEATIDHGFGVKTKWKMTAEGQKPPNPPIEVVERDGGWIVLQHRTNRVLSTWDDKNDAISAAGSVATEHEAELILP
jgi:hypothetical protein